MNWVTTVNASTPVIETGESPRSWRTGEILKAIVIRGTAVPGDRAEIQIGSLRVGVTPDRPLKEATEVLLQVVRRNEQTALRLLERPATGASDADPGIDRLDLLTRALAPRQETPARLLATLRAVVERGAPTIPPNVLAAAAQATQGIPPPHHLVDSGQLRRLVEASLHPRQDSDGKMPLNSSSPQSTVPRLVSTILQALASAGEAPGGSFSTAMQSPLPTRTGAPTPISGAPSGTLLGLEPHKLIAELHGAAAGASARVQLQQLVALESSVTDTPRWQLELPVRWGDQTALISLVLQREPRPAQDTGSPPLWIAILAWDLPRLGPMQARISLFGDQVSVHFYSENEATANEIHNTLAELRAALQSRDLIVGRIASKRGKHPETGRGARRQLLDLRA